MRAFNSENTGRSAQWFASALCVWAVMIGVVFANGEGSINFSFDQVDVHAFVRLVGEITGRQFVVAEGINKKITVVSPRVERNEVYPLFLSILESSGCTIVREGDLYRVVVLPESATPIGRVVGPDEESPTEGLVTRIFHLQHVQSADLRDVLMPMVSGGKQGTVGAVKDTNHLIITDTAESLRKIEKIIAEIDRPGLARSIEILSLEYVGAEEIAEQLNMAMEESETRGEILRRRLPDIPGRGTTSGRTKATVVAAPHSNSLMLVGTVSQLTELKRIIKQMDVDAPSTRGRLNAIFLKYISAVDTAKSINALLQKSSEIGKNAAQKRKIAIEASEANNALLVDALSGDYENVKRLIEQIDILPQQVHIEVLILEVSASDDINIGVEMAVVEMPAEVGSTVVQGGTRLFSGADGLMNVIQNGIFPSGLTVGIAHGSRLDGDGNVVVGYPGIINIDAIKRSGSVRIRSETALETQNNKEASVVSVNEIPILKSTIEGGSGSARDVIQNIDRIDVGIKLKLTPHVIPGGEVQMDINTGIEAVIDAGSSTLQFTPTIAKREVITSVTVPDGDMIVIAGLTREDKKKVVKKVPILGSIPLLGWLFRHTVDIVENTNVLIFVTPRILTDRTVVESVMESWQEKTGLKAYEKK